MGESEEKPNAAYEGSVTSREERLRGTIVELMFLCYLGERRGSPLYPLDPPHSRQIPPPLPTECTHGRQVKQGAALTRSSDAIV